jgi:hypothetical protein
MDKNFIVWDIETEKIKFNVTLSAPALRIEWSKVSQDLILIVLQDGKNLFKILKLIRIGHIQMANLADKFVYNIDMDPESRP